jgi:hypothetical protein
MTPRVFPEQPQFKTDSEENVFEILFNALSDEDVIFCNLQLVHPQHGDVEVDFTILMKDRGIMVIEVKGGHITFDGGGWKQSDSHGSRIIYPAFQARKAMYSLRDHIRDRWSQGNVRTDWIVIFPQSRVVNVDAPDLPTGKYMDKDDLKYPLSKIKSLLDLASQFQVPSGNSWIEAGIKALQGRSALNVDQSGVLASAHDYVKELTHRRANLLDQISENHRYYIHGPAGSGKTWMAFEQAKRWNVEGKKVAIIAYNRGLISYMQMRNSELPIELQIPWIGTFHDYAKHLGTSVGAPSKLKEDDDIYGPSLIAAAKALENEKRFDALIVDEAQDFMGSWFECLTLSLSDAEYGKMALFGDDQQKVFGKRKGPKGVFARFSIDENIRNSQQIAILAASLVERSIVVRGPNSFAVEFIECAEEDAIEAADEKVSQLTDSEFWQSGEIALLTTKRRHPVQIELADRDKLKYWESLWTSDDVFYGTVSGFKGLERPVVVLAVDGFHDAEDFDDFLYVGLTRARDKLVIIGTKGIKKKIWGNLKN